MLKKYILLFFSRQQFDTISHEVEAESLDAAASKAREVLVANHLINLEGEEPEDYDCTTLEEAAEEQVEGEEYYLVCVMNASAEHKSMMDEI